MASEQFKMPLPLVQCKNARVKSSDTINKNVSMATADSPDCGAAVDSSSSSRDLGGMASDRIAECSRGEAVDDSVDESANSSALCESERSPIDVAPPTNTGVSSTATASNRSQRSGAESQIVAAVPAAVFAPPAWCGLPSQQKFWLEVVRGGVTLPDTYSLHTRTHTVFGRQVGCDVVLQHPSVSRFHAVLVYRAVSDSESSPAGYYLYDMTSTHGTILNKQRLQPRTYTRMRVGHMCRLGGSTRLFILHGPSEDAETESESSVTQLRQIAANKKKMSTQLHHKDDNDDDGDGDSSAVKPELSEGINWGMSEDACEDTDLSFNPFALSDSDNSHLYLEDPKRTLRGWFEREGYELSYETEQVSAGEHLCRVELPVDDVTGVSAGRVVAEVRHNGRKRDAVVQCALQACRMLDRAGLLRRATHVARGKRSCGATCSDDDDDDTFLDRTGHVESRRIRKKRQTGGEYSGDGCGGVDGKRQFTADNSSDAGGSGSGGGSKNIPEPSQPLTHQQLIDKLAAVGSEIEQLEQLLRPSRVTAVSCKDEDSGDALDTFMNGLRENASIVNNSYKSAGDALERRKTKVRIESLRSEKVHLQKLIELTRPNTLPPLSHSSSSSVADSAVVAEEGATVAGRKTPAIFIGKRKGCGVGLKRVMRAQPTQNASKDKIGDMEGALPSRNCEQKLPQAKAAEAESVDRKKEENISDRLIGDVKSSSPSLTPPMRVAPHTSVTEVAPARRTDRKLGSRRNDGGDNGDDDGGKLSSRDQNQEIEQQKTEYVCHSVWMPPAGQTGDGRTSLNDKFGY